MQIHFILVMYHGAVQCFHFHGLVLNELETAPPKTNDCGRHWESLKASKK